MNSVSQVEQEIIRISMEANLYEWAAMPAFTKKHAKTCVERVQRLATLDKPEEKELLEVSRLMESN